MTFKGVDAMGRKIKAIARKFPDTVEGALRIEAELIMTRSKMEFVPVDLGTLRNSGFVDSVKNRVYALQSNEIGVVLGFGGAAADYAHVVHETPSGFDPPSWQGKVIAFSPKGRGPKYLERPMMDAVPGLEQRIAARIQVRSILEGL